MSQFAPLAAAMLVIASGLDVFAAAQTQNRTVVTVGEMCGGCVKKINAKLDGFPGIATVQCDTRTKTVTITPTTNSVLSPRQLWDALDEIGKTPVKMVGPGGTFTSKPKS
jgi:copper chaperone CopZ